MPDLTVVAETVDKSSKLDLAPAFQQIAADLLEA